MIKKIFTVTIPLLLAVLQYFHPYHFLADVYHELLPHLHLWLTIHILQLALFGGVAVVFYLMLDHVVGIWAKLARFFIWCFAITYTAYDAIAGIATGSLIRIGTQLPADSQEMITNVIQKFFTDPIYGGTHSILSETASLSALLAIWGCAAALWIAGKCSKLPLILYFIAGPFLWTSHAYPDGPIAFGLISLANLWIALDRKHGVK